jgi:hypothetical protein
MKGNEMSTTNAIEAALRTVSDEYLTELKMDRERLDWLEKNIGTVWVYGNEVRFKDTPIQSKSTWMSNPTTRQAIDAAMEETK